MIMARLKSHNVQEVQLACGMGRSLYLGLIKSRLGQQAFCLTLEQGWVRQQTVHISAWIKMSRSIIPQEFNGRVVIFWQTETNIVFLSSS